MRSFDFFDWFVESTVEFRLNSRQSSVSGVPGEGAGARRAVPARGDGPEAARQLDGCASQGGSDDRLE